MTTLTRPKKLLAQPVYQRIEADLRDRIRVGAWTVGAPLPSRSALAKEYGVGLATLERAVAELLADGTLRAVPGQHTVVALGREASLTSGTPSTTHRANLETTPTVLGIVSHDAISEIRSRGSEGGWLYQSAHCLERAFLAGGGRTLFTSLKPSSGGESLSLADAVRRLRGQGAVTIAVVDLNAAIAASEIQQLANIQESDAILFVHISDSETDTGIPHVYYDSAHLGRQAVQHLVSRGFDAFTYISPFRLQWSVDRFEQARGMAEALGLGAAVVTSMIGDRDTIDETQSHAAQQYDAAMELGTKHFGSPDYPRCIIAANDYTAFGLIDASHKYGLTQGEDYAIVGFDDEVKALQYGLSTFRPPLEEVGTEAALLLTRLLRGESCSLQVRLRSRLVARASTMNK